MLFIKIFSMCSEWVNEPVLKTKLQSPHTPKLDHFFPQYITIFMSPFHFIYYHSSYYLWFSKQLPISAPFSLENIVTCWVLFLKITLNMSLQEFAIDLNGNLAWSHWFAISNQAVLIVSLKQRGKPTQTLFFLNRCYGSLIHRVL